VVNVTVCESPAPTRTAAATAVSPSRNFDSGKSAVASSAIAAMRYSPGRIGRRLKAPVFETRALRNIRAPVRTSRHRVRSIGNSTTPALGSGEPARLRTVPMTSAGRSVNSSVTSDRFVDSTMNGRSVTICPPTVTLNSDTAGLSLTVST
jgi:hypothetical protein